MSISIGRFVSITSAVAAGGGVAQRELIGRLISEDPKTPVDQVIEFTSASDVGAFYGFSSVEYRRAVFYFGFISKSLSQPQRLSFGRLVRTAQAARIYGTAPVGSLLEFQAITGGTLSLTIGAQTANLTGLNFAAAVALSDVAATLQTAIRAAAGAQFTTATVTYDAIAGAFNFVASSGETASAAISVNAAAAGSVATLLGWATGAVFSPASPVQSISEALTATMDITNNCGSIAFVSTSLTNDEKIEAATWNDARNVEFLLTLRTVAADAVALSAAVLGLAGCAVTLTPDAAEFDEMLPMMVLAATNYARPNAVQNYMFQQTGSLTAKVVTNALADFYDPLRVNYYGQTQTAGQRLAFYQRGVMMGGATDPLDMNVYANEVWFKDAAQSALLGALLALPRVPANAEGVGQVLAILQDVIDRALLNGTISVGKTLTNTQRTYVSQITGTDDAWQQVQSIGYWVTCVIEPRVAQSGVTEFVAVYTLVYGKDDTIRKVEGQHILV